MKSLFYVLVVLNLIQFSALASEQDPKNCQDVTVDSGNVQLTYPMRGEIEGTLIQTPFAQGSKSDHMALAIQRDDGHTILVRLKGDNPFEMNPVLLQHLGKQVRVKGIFVSAVQMVNGEWSLLSPSAP